MLKKLDLTSKVKLLFPQKVHCDDVEVSMNVDANMNETALHIVLSRTLRKT
jgi:hypothetical protein